MYGVSYSHTFFDMAWLVVIHIRTLLSGVVEAGVEAGQSGATLRQSRNSAGCRADKAASGGLESRRLRLVKAYQTSAFGNAAPVSPYIHRKFIVACVPELPCAL